MHKILIVDDEPAARYGIRRALEGPEIQAFEAGNAEAARRLIRLHRPDVMLADINMPNEDGIALLNSLEQDPQSPLTIMVTAYGAAKVAVEAMKAGAYDYIIKPFEIDELRMAVERALEWIALEEENRELKRQVLSDGHFGGMIGKSPAMLRVFEVAEKLAATDVTVLIQGESGTGKELLAREIHERSPRAAGPFVAVNCAALPETLIESELFGYEKGAFTGASQQRAGKFEQAHRGTLFLDEIGDMNPVTQAKVLRALEERTVERLGGSRTIPVDVRILSATHKDTAAEVAAGRFREDLFFRLKVVIVQIPPLRQRSQDLPLLIQAFLGVYASRHNRPGMSLATKALDRLHRYSWPGNVRELRNVIEGCIVLSRSSTIQVQDLPPEIRDLPARPGMDPGGPSFHEGGEPEGSAGKWLSLPYREARKQFETDYIAARLRDNGGNVSRTAAQIGLHRQSLHQKLRELGIESRHLGKSAGR